MGTPEFDQVYQLVVIRAPHHDGVELERETGGAGTGDPRQHVGVLVRPRQFPHPRGAQCVQADRNASQSRAAQILGLLR